MEPGLWSSSYSRGQPRTPVQPEEGSSPPAQFSVSPVQIPPQPHFSHPSAYPMVYLVRIKLFVFVGAFMCVLSFGPCPPQAPGSGFPFLSTLVFRSIRSMADFLFFNLFVTLFPRCMRDVRACGRAGALTNALNHTHNHKHTLFFNTPYSLLSASLGLGFVSHSHVVSHAYMLIVGALAFVITNPNYYITCHVRVSRTHKRVLSHTHKRGRRHATRRTHATRTSTRHAHARARRRPAPHRRRRARLERPERRDEP